MQNNYYNIDAKVRCGNIEFEAIKSIRIESNIHKFTDTAKIELPREFSHYQGNQQSINLAGKNILEFIKIGDPIEIELGYNNELAIEFKGYITSIGADIPLVIECEDEMYKLKNAALLNKTFAKVSLKELLNFVAKGYEIETFNLNMGKFMIQKATPYKVLESLKKDFGLISYFKDNVLHSGFAIDMKPQNVHKFVFGKNIRESSDLKFITKESKKLFIKAKSLKKGNFKKAVTYEFGEKGGSERTLHAPMNLTKNELKEWCEKYYENYVFDGYSGTIKSWGLPRTKAGDAVQITDPNYTDEHRNGKYLIESVVIDVNESVGFERKNKISVKL